MYGFYFNALSLLSRKRGAALALKVFSVPRKGRLSKLQESYLDTARKQKIAFEDGLIQLYHWKGDGDTILLFHGWESNAWRWKYLIEPLQEKGYNIIAIDAPAHGASDGEQFTAVKYSKVITTVIELYEPQIVIAHSVGAMATVYQESQHQHKFINKLVLLGSPNRLEVIFKGYQQLVGFNSKVYQELDNLLKSLYGFHIEEFETATFARDIKTPALLIHSPADVIVPIDSLQPIAEALENSETFVSETGGHSLHTPEVVSRIIAFLEN
ncbi:alpha/beta hydrolase [Nonlabens ponticola]|uniref:Alpha/beta hydrolase n=1 Tax=Nonlabens ponticola TaxID=2496866 RepID=A0A3S9N1A9_9FLAO|nr:alpha/beta hydrolase [Nonlabens ponticola]